MNIFNIIILLSYGFIASCGGGSGSDNNRGSAIETAVIESMENKILPTVVSFENRAELFNNSAADFCDNSDTQQLESLQQAWRSLSTQWAQLEMYNFGPLNDDVVFPRYTFINSLRIRGTNYTETVRTDISKNIAGDYALDTTYFNNQNFQKVGLLPLELLSFETAAKEQSTNQGDIVSEYKTTPRKCLILKGLAQQVLSQAEYFKNGWETEYKDTAKPFSELFISEELEDGSLPIVTLITSIQQHLDYLDKRHVATVAAQVSDNSWQNISASIDEIESLLAGSDKTTVSYFSLMTSAGYQESVDLVKENIDAIRQALTAKDSDLLEVTLGKLDGNFKREIPTGLAVTLTLNFTDGD